MLNKIRTNAFLKSTLILLFGGALGKIVGFFLKIIITRKLGTHTMGLYSMLMPTSSLLSVLAVFYYSNAISKIISEKSSNTKSLFVSIIPISFLINTIIISIVFLFAKILSYNLVESNKLYYPIICIAACMPFISMSAIIKGYFWGKQNMMPYMLSNFIEQVVRLLLVIFFIDYYIYKGEIYSLCFIILINVIGEISSQIVMILFVPKIRLSLKDLKINTQVIKKVMSFCIPTTFSKIIGSISYFLEPIVLSYSLIKVGYSNEYVIYEYGIINAYAMSTLLMCQFFTQNMSTSLIPELSKLYSINDIKMCAKRIKQIVLTSSFIGITSTLIIFLFPSLILKLLYNTNEGIDYIRLLCPFTVLFYIEYPLVESLQALGKIKEAFYVTIKTSVIRLSSIYLLSFFKIGMYSFILAIIINLICSTLLYYKEVKNVLKVT